jgi:hypothetical protein
MREFSSAFIAEKNKRQGGGAWAHLVEVELNVNTTAYFVSNTDTATWNSNVYIPLPMRISAEEQTGDGSLPQMTIDVSNPGGLIYKAAKDNDLSLKQVTIRLVNLNLTSSGDDARVQMKILGTTFAEEIGRFTLGFGFNYDADGPKRVYNRIDHNCIPVAMRQYAIIG